MARRVAGRSPVGSSHLIEALRRDLDVAVPRAEELVAGASGIPAPVPVRWDLIDRARWTDANIAGMTELLRPLAEKVARRLDTLPPAVKIAQRSVVSVEVGVLLGYVSRRVLGQYDLLVPEGSGAGEGNGAALYFVGVNMVETERRFSFVPADFALWVATHEVTHRFQFAGVPWLRERFFSLVHSYLEALDLDARGLARRLAGAAARLASRSTPPEERHPVYLLASEEQRARLDEIQALMAVVEGHGNFVMDAVGAAVIPSFRRMRGVFHRRRQQVGAVQRAINHVLGLEMKLRQYELGQSFCEHVAAHAGTSALGALWSSADNLPTLGELKEPDLWLRRVA
ncbi:MAG: zinc-dependent metalloprotease [Actinomycetota bacterium]